MVAGAWRAVSSERCVVDGWASFLVVGCIGGCWPVVGGETRVVRGGCEEARCGTKHIFRKNGGYEAESMTRGIRRLSGQHQLERTINICIPSSRIRGEQHLEEHASSTGTGPIGSREAKEPREPRQPASVEAPHAGAPAAEAGTHAQGTVGGRVGLFPGVRVRRWVLASSE